MKSTQLYSTLREHLAPAFKANGFKRATPMLSWLRSRGALFEAVWCQASQDGWDAYAGSKFVVEFQLGPEPVIGGKAFCRKRIGALLNAAEREEVRAIQNAVIACLQKPPKTHVPLIVSEEVSGWYLKKFNLVHQPYLEADDIWFRYASSKYVVRWAEFIVSKIPSCLRQIEKWDQLISSG